MATPEKRHKYYKNAHQRAVENPRPCANACGRDAAPRRTLCYPCKGDEQRSGGRTYYQQRAAAVKAEAVQAYGGRCLCCGESEPAFLSLRNTTPGARQYKDAWVWARSNAYPATLRLLCLNCNHAEQNGGCPHLHP